LRPTNDERFRNPRHAPPSLPRVRRATRAPQEKNRRIKLHTASLHDEIQPENTTIAPQQTRSRLNLFLHCRLYWREIQKPTSKQRPTAELLNLPNGQQLFILQHAPSVALPVQNRGHCKIQCCKGAVSRQCAGEKTNVAGQQPLCTHPALSSHAVEVECDARLAPSNSSRTVKSATFSCNFRNTSLP
jgi:hypothetical protein